ncbi:MAG: AraC family transcriptional regulator [Pyrinomonadaceae bacterium]|nr:AraC family transcriptional regulator [Pyrinomonadaceae bacterium]
MNYQQTGKFRGNTFQTISFEGVTATETDYDYKFIDWHYHENPYFSLNILGTCIENNKRESFECLPGSLLFHNCHEPHFNTKKDSLTRGFQIEVSQDWCKKFEIDLDKLPKSQIIPHPNVKLSFYNIYKESKLSDTSSNLSVDAMLLQIFETMQSIESSKFSIKPSWVKKIDEILHDNFDQPLSLQQLSTELNVHWVHLSRDFPRYFRCNFSEYVRKIRVEKSLYLLKNNNLSLTEIALICGFADQSHFIRSFKSFHGITPKKFRQIISR